MATGRRARSCRTSANATPPGGEEFVNGCFRSKWTRSLDLRWQKACENASAWIQNSGCRKPDSIQNALRRRLDLCDIFVSFFEMAVLCCFMLFYCLLQRPKIWLSLHCGIAARNSGNIYASLRIRMRTSFARKLTDCTAVWTKTMPAVTQARPARSTPKQKRTRKRRLGND